MVLFGCGNVLFIFLIRNLLEGCRTLVVLLLLVRWKLVCGVLGIRNFGKIEKRGYDLPKRQMFVNVLGLIFESSQFPNDGEPMFFGMLFFMGKVSGLCILV